MYSGQGQARQKGLKKQDIEQRMSYQNGYTLITPNERKRKQIIKVARRETKAYEAHKERNTPKQFNYVGTTGGWQKTQAAARRKLIQTARTKTGKMLKNQQRKTYFKQKEEEEIQMKKTKQRKKAEVNARRKKEQDQVDALMWDNKKRRQNDAFLKRLENKNRTYQHGEASVGQAASSSSSCPSPSTRTEVPSRSASYLHLASLALQTALSTVCPQQ